tara:strand:+ start:92 stop:433 length:342 start_codon:yes stop_codon:yes gene_type:complete
MEQKNKHNTSTSTSIPKSTPTPTLTPKSDSFVTYPANKFNVLNYVISQLILAIGLVCALSWNDALKSLFESIGLAQWGPIVRAIIVTIFLAVTLFSVSKISTIFVKSGVMNTL